MPSVTKCSMRLSQQTHQAIKPKKAKKVVLTAEQKEAKVIDFGNKRMESHRDDTVIMSPAWGEFIPKTYLPTKVKGINGKNYPIFKSLPQAFAVAEYHNLCYFCEDWEYFEGMTPVGGITLVAGGFDLRKSSKPVAEKTSGKGKDLRGALGSWVFDFEKAEEEEVFKLDDELNRYVHNDQGGNRHKLIKEYFGDAKGHVDYLWAAKQKALKEQKISELEGKVTSMEKVQESMRETIKTLKGEVATMRETMKPKAKTILEKT